MEKRAMKNLIVRQKKTGIIVDFKPGQGDNIEEFRWVEEKGYELEQTDRCYIRRWGKWWETYPDGTIEEEYDSFNKENLRKAHQAYSDNCAKGRKKANKNKPTN